MAHIKYLKEPATKIKAKILKQLKVLKDNETIDNELCYYLKRTDFRASRFYHLILLCKSQE